MDFGDLLHTHLPVVERLNASRAARDHQHTDEMICILIPVGRQIMGSVARTTVSNRGHKEHNMTDRDDNIDAAVMNVMQRYPDLFRPGTGPMRDGFLCERGWYPLLDRLFSDINDIRRDDNLTRIRVSQVKQKLGELRAYVQGGNERVSDRIRQAEAEAVVSCEDCGGPSPGIGSIGGYVTNACDPCLDKRKRELLDR